MCWYPESRDGRIIKPYGIINGARIIDGSSSRGGVSAYKKMRRELDSGCLSGNYP
jgi:lysophospholipid acyltransferase (LPLAT)-like uncharacterized protein